MNTFNDLLQYQKIHHQLHAKIDHNIRTAKPLTDDSSCLTCNFNTDLTELSKDFQTFFNWAIDNLETQGYTDKGVNVFKQAITVPTIDL